MADKHTNRLGYIVGPILDRVNMEWYERTFKRLEKLNNGELELKKDIVYKGGENQ